MTILQIKKMLETGEVPADRLNFMIDTLSINYLEHLSDSEKESVREIISKALVMMQDASSGAYIHDPAKAESLLSAIK